MTIDRWLALSPELWLLGLVTGMMLLEILRGDARWGRLAFAATLLVTLALLVRQLSSGLAVAIVPGEYVVDRFAVLGKIVLASCTLAYACGFPGPRTLKTWLLASASLLGGFVMLGSASFATLFIGIELLSLPAFALIVHGQPRGRASEGAFKYLVLSSVASATLLFGVSLAYGVHGTLALQAWADGFQAGVPMSRVAGVLVLSGLFLKAAVFPFHAWAPDAYAAARLPVTALMASLVKAAVILALARVSVTIALDPAAATLVASLAIASIVFGNLAALAQQGLRRLLAYSSVAHAGYMVFALLDATGTRSDDLLWYTAIYGLATVLACASFAALSRRGDDDSLSVVDGAFAAHPVAACLFAIALLSLAGVPPMPGFFAKVLVFRSVIASGHVLPAVLAFAGSFLGLAYYVGLVLRLARVREAPAAAGAASIDDPDGARRRDAATV